MSGLRPPKLHPPPNPDRQRVRKGRIKSAELERRHLPSQNRRMSADRYGGGGDLLNSSDSQLSDTSDMSEEVSIINSVGK